MSTRYSSNSSIGTALLFIEGRPPANALLLLRPWPWPWPNDLDTQTWPLSSKYVLATHKPNKNELSRSRLSKS